MDRSVEARGQTKKDEAWLLGYSKKVWIIIAVVVVILIVLILFWLSSGGGKKGQQPQHNNNGGKKKKTKSGNDQSIQNIKIEPASNGQTKVSWDPVESDNLTHYIMYYSERQDFDKNACNRHNPITEPSILLASDVPRQYYFRVAAVRNVEGQEVEGPLSELNSMFLSVAEK